MRCPMHCVSFHSSAKLQQISSFQLPSQCEKLLVKLVVTENHTRRGSS